MTQLKGEERAVLLAREAVELADAGHREEAFKRLREAFSLAEHNPDVRSAFQKIQEEEGASHRLINLCRKYTSCHDECAGKEAARYLATDALKPPESVALECLKLLLEQRPSALSEEQDHIVSGLVRSSTSVRQFFSSQLQASATSFFDEIFDRGDAAAVCLDAVVLDPTVWPSEDPRFHCECELFQLFIAKLMESGNDLDGRALKGIARLLAVDAAKLQSLVDDESLEVILSSLDNRLPLELRSQATLATVKYLEAAKDVGEKRLSRLISGKVEKGRNDDLIIALSSAAAVFPVAPAIVSNHFLSDEFMARLAQIVYRSMKNQAVELSMLELLNAACISATCREAIRKSFSEWLSHVLTNGSDESSELAAVVLAKVRTSSKDEPLEDNGKAQEQDSDVSELVGRFKGLISSQKGNTSILIEGFAYSSVKPAVRKQLAEDPIFLRELIQTLRENITDSATLYGGLMTLVNLAEFAPNLSEEQRRVLQLQSYANLPKNSMPKTETDPLNEEDAVIARCNAIVNAGVMPLLVECSRISRSSTRELVSKILLSLSRSQRSRGILTQQGAVKLLLSIATEVQNSHGIAQAEAARNASHALARILISVNPSHAFTSSGPLHAVSAVRPLAALVAPPETSALVTDQPRDLLPVFEGLLALTNLASLPGTEAAEAIVGKLWTSLEDLLLSDNTFIQRATCELVCNLVACESGAAKFADGSKRAALRMHILLALTDAEDSATRRAAGGALAMLTEQNAAVSAILDRDRGVTLLLGLCQDEDDGQVHRGIVCIQNMTCVASEDIAVRARAAVKEAGGVQVLTNALLRTSNSAILQAGAEALKPLME